MKQFMLVGAAFWAVVLDPSVSLGGWFGPSTYEECVLESMKGVVSDQAAAAIIRACRAKFPEKRPNDPEVPVNVFGQLSGRAGMTGYGYFQGSIYNGNKDWTITQITVLLTPKLKDKFLDLGSYLAQEYIVVISVPPLTNRDFTVSADDGGSREFDWRIKSARGHQSR